MEVLKLQPLSYPLLTLAIMANITIYELCFIRSRYTYALSIPLRPLLWLTVVMLNMLGRIGEGFCRVDSFPFGHLVVARKQKILTPP